jgi:hypothetical protein
MLKYSIKFVKNNEACEVEPDEKRVCCALQDVEIPSIIPSPIPEYPLSIVLFPIVKFRYTRL